MVSIQRWCRITVVGPDGAVLTDDVLEGPAPPDLGAMDEVARWGLTEVSPAMQELLELGGLGIEVQG
jgi:hypothetical protein